MQSGCQSTGGKVILFEICGSSERVINTHPAHFHQVGHHDDSRGVLLPDHPPEIKYRLLHGAYERHGEMKLHFTNIFFPAQNPMLKILTASQKVLR